jgi:hypothetical protein
MSNIFEQATRMKLRYPSNRGLITTEDLWELPLNAKNGFALDDVAKAINKELKAAQEESFTNTVPNPARTMLELQLEIVKHVIAVVIAENNARLALAGKKAEKDRLLEILASKQQEKLMGMTEEQIQARIKELEVA